MNVIFVEPGFPENQRQFVRALHGIGARVTGIGERPFDWLDDEIRRGLAGYEQVGSVTDERSLHDAVRRVQARGMGRSPRGHGRSAHPAHGQGARGLHDPGHLGAHRLSLPRQGGDEGGAARGGRALRRVGCRLERCRRRESSRRQWAFR